MNRAKIQLLLYLLVVSIIITACLFAGTTAFADPPGRKHVIQRHETHHGRVVANLHGGHHRPFVRSAKYYHRSAPFYKKRPPGSLVIGASITTLPVGYTRAVVHGSSNVVHGSSNYVAGGIYYRQIRAGYRVVEAPRKVVIVDNPRQQTIPVTILPEQVKVSAAALNVRTGPGLHHGVIQQVQKNEILRVLNSEPGWLYVRLPSGQSGWVMDSFTVPVRPLASG